MKRKTIIIGTLALLIVAASAAYYFRRAVAVRLSALRSGATATAGQEHAGHTMPEATQAHDHSASTPAQRKVLYWYDPMHPHYKSDKPGTAPDCGMDLVPMYEDEAGAEEGLSAGSVRISAEKQQMIGVRTTTVSAEHVTRTLRAVGRVELDETRIARVHVKFAGWIEKVNIDYVGKQVQKGQALFAIYSPELVSTQQEYLIALRGRKYLQDSPYAEVSAGAESLVGAARDRLRLWDISDDQIEKLEQSGQVSRTLTIYSPATGFVLERKAYEGSYATPDTELYTIADLSSVWVNAEIYEYEVPYVRVGQTAKLSLPYFPGKVFAGRVSYIYPNVDAQTRTLKARLEFTNADFELKPQMFADVELEIDYGKHVVVPQEAVLDAGARQMVFLARADGHFNPREVKLGARVGERVIVLAGLRPGETIVTSGNFLIDSESRLKSALSAAQHTGH